MEEFHYGRMILWKNYTMEKLHPISFRQSDQDRQLVKTPLLYKFVYPIKASSKTRIRYTRFEHRCTKVNINQLIKQIL